MTSRPCLLQNTALPPALDARLEAAFDVVRLPSPPAAAGLLAEQGARFEGLVTSAAVGADAALMAALPALKIISSFGVGLDRIDLAAAARRGIAVGYTPEVLDDCVADTAIGLLIDVARRLSAADRFVRAGRWPGARFPLTTKVSGKNLGIVGLGRIGRAIARRAEGFGMAIRYHNRRPRVDVGYGYEASLPELARWADFLVVAAAGGSDTRHLVDRDVLDALGPRGFLVNVARGSVVDEAALVDALLNRRIAGAGLDVFADEPKVPEALFGLDHVVLLPHLASGTEETRQAMADRVFDNLQRFFAEGRLVSAAPLPDPLPTDQA